jgi:hypothetical protein
VRTSIAYTSIRFAAAAAVATLAVVVVVAAAVVVLVRILLTLNLSDVTPPYMTADSKQYFLHNPYVCYDLVEWVCGRSLAGTAG